MPMILTEGVSPASQPLSKAVFVLQGTCSRHESSELYSFTFWEKNFFSVPALPFEQLSLI